jgi:aspartyl-tRNA(Asn)/glutamyl-tRNA(Gln) amidotransferase subunit B
MRALNLLVRYLGVSEADMEKGQMRCDANVSLRRPGAEKYGTRTELKNINSFRFVQKAIEHEIARQARILDDGGTIVQETRLWDADAGQSQSMRGKEEAMDYRYFPDPDLPPLAVERLAIELPELPMARFDRYVAAGLSVDDARTFIGDPTLADHLDAAHAVYPSRGLASWILSERGRQVAPAALAALVKLIDDEVISGKIAKDVLSQMIATGDAPDAIVERAGLRQITDAGAIEALARQIVDANPKQAAQYRGGKEGLIGFFVGALLKASGGKANPALASEVLKKILAGS